MNTKARVIHFCALLMIQILFSCDTLDKDGIRPTVAQSEYYILPGTSVVIDLTSLANQSFTNVSISISENPSRGRLTQVETLLFKYKPGLEFRNGYDQFSINLKSDGKTLTSQKVKIHMKGVKEEFPCTFIAVEDKVKATRSSSISIPVLTNDWFCGTSPPDVTISIQTNPRFGEVSINSETLVYRPGSAFKGADEIIYKLARSTGESDVYGIVTISGWAAQILRAPSSARTMFFVDEGTGYLGGNGLYKTTDGGENWNQIFDSQDIRFRSITDIHFVDEKNGFVVYHCNGYDAPCLDGLMKTADGGNSWKEIPLELFRVIPFSSKTSSIFFTSRTTGFMTTISTESFDYGGWLPTFDLPPCAKTNDGGTSWENVWENVWESVSSSNKYGSLRTSIGFSDADTGYVFLAQNIITTTDGGESWTHSLSSNQEIASVDVVRGLILCASTTNTSSVTPNSSVVRTTDGVKWNEVGNFPYEITHLGFSPSGNVGLAIGINRNDHLSSDPTKNLSINTSTDKGETWTTEYIEDFIDAPLLAHPKALIVPSDNVFYILYDNKIIKYTNY